MAYKIDYEFKIDKAGRKYALKVNLNTGKKERVKYDLAEKRQKKNISERKRNVIKAKLKETDSGATYKEYIDVSKNIEKEIAEKRKKTGKAPYKKSTMRGMVKQKAIYERTGIATRFRYMWIFKKKLEYIDEDTGKMYYECASPEFTTEEYKTNGNDFDAMINDCMITYNEIRALDLCSLDGGACVISVIDQFELGKGCGFSFAFRDTNNNIIYELEDGYFSDKNGRK
jgi:hypothetical protein